MLLLQHNNGPLQQQRLHTAATMLSRDEQSRSIAAALKRSQRRLTPLLPPPPPSAGLPGASPASPPLSSPSSPPSPSASSSPLLLRPETPPLWPASMESQELIATRASPSPSASSSARSALLLPAVAATAPLSSTGSEPGDAGGDASFTPLFSPCSLSASTSSSTPARSSSPSSSSAASSASSSSSPLHLPATPRALAATCGSFSCLPPPSFQALLSSLRAFLHTEASFPPPIDYTHAVQLECSLQDRDIIVQYLQASAQHWQLHADTAHLAVCVFDRFMARRSVKRPYLQLAALASLLLAVKMAESQLPSLRQLSLDTNGLYSPDMIREMELLILSELQYRLSDTSAVTALSHVLQAFAHALPPHIRHTAHHILCSSSAASVFIACTASLLAIAALFAAFRWHGQAAQGVSFIVEQYQHWVCGSAQGSGEVVAMGAVVLVSQEMMAIVTRQADAQMLHDDSDDDRDGDDHDGRHQGDDDDDQQQQQPHGADDGKEADGGQAAPPTPAVPGTPQDELTMDMLTPPPAQPAAATTGDVSESIRDDLDDTDTEDVNCSSSSRLKRRRLVYYH